MHVAMLLEMTADAAGDRVAVGSRNGGLTAAQLLRGAKHVGARLSSGGFGNVAHLGVNSEVVPLLLFSTSYSGKPFAPLNYRLDDERLSDVLASLAPVLLVVDPEMAERVQGIEGVTIVGRDELLGDVAAAGPEDDALEAVAGEDDVAVLLFTSGTTGAPKAAVLRHRHLVSYVLSTVEFLGADPEEAQLVSVPPYHIAGTSSILTSILSGRRLYYLPAFDTADWVRAVETEGITQAMVVPTMLGRILDEVAATGADLSSLRNVAYGGGRMPIPVIERAMRELPHVGWTNAYGLTETSSTISVLGPDDHVTAISSDDPAVRRRLGSVGRPLPTVELEIRDETGRALGPGEKGEVHVRGEQIAGEYLGRSVLGPDGWFPTNDAGWIDDEGYLFLEGRLDDVIVRGAENLSPGEIEDVLMEHPEVDAAAVVGVPSQEWGEKVVAAVVLEPGATATEGELKQWVRDRLRSAKTPERIEVRDELPFSETGKLLRRVLREELADPVPSS